MDFKKINKISVSEEIIDYLKGQIISRKLLPGEKLPSEENLAVSMGVGRGTIREALKILIHLGLVERKKNGTYVTEGSSTENYDIEIRMNEYRDLIEVIEVRKVIEPALAELAALRADSEIIIKLSEKLTKMKESTGDMDSFIEFDSEFHDLIFKAANNSILAHIIQESKDLLKKNQRIVLRERYSQIMPRSLKYHEEIYMAIEKRDKDTASEMMSKHIKDIEKEFELIFNTV